MSQDTLIGEPITIKTIVKFLAEQEGKLSQVSIGNIREIVGLISELVYESSDTVAALHANGKRRNKRLGK